MPPPKPQKQRLDLLLVERGLTKTREKAQALVMAGEVTIDGQPAQKPGQSVPVTAALAVREPLPYVSRGGLKLARALDVFGIDPSGLTLLDAGASNGGFTDCLLQRGAEHVIAVDVGLGQLDWKLRSNPRVTVLDRTNIRYLAELPRPAQAAVIDVSFISLGLVLPAVVRLLGPGSLWVIALVKPQFEAGRDQVGKGGVVRDAAVHRLVLERVLRSAIDAGLAPIAGTASPIKGPAGNVEFLVNFGVGCPGNAPGVIVEACLAAGAALG